MTASHFCMERRSDIRADSRGRCGSSSAVAGIGGRVRDSRSRGGVGHAGDGTEPNLGGLGFGMLGFSTTGETMAGARGDVAGRPLGVGGSISLSSPMMVPKPLGSCDGIGIGGGGNCPLEG